ncbi:S24 family peptidase, partial [Enterococcus faecium]
IEDGALVLIDEEDRRIIDAVFAFVLEGEARIKRFRKLTDGVMLVSDNPLYPPEKVTGDDLRKLQIIGRARWVGNML